MCCGCVLVCLFAMQCSVLQIVIFLPALCRKMDIPYCIVKVRTNFLACYHNGQPDCNTWTWCIDWNDLAARKFYSGPLHMLSICGCSFSCHNPLRIAYLLTTIEQVAPGNGCAQEDGHCCCHHWCAQGRPGRVQQASWSHQGICFDEYVSFLWCAFFQCIRMFLVAECEYHDAESTCVSVGYLFFTCNEPHPFFLCAAQLQRPLHRSQPQVGRRHHGSQDSAQSQDVRQGQG